MSGKIIYYLTGKVFIFSFPFIECMLAVCQVPWQALKVGGQDPEESTKSDPVLTVFCLAGALGEGTVPSSCFFYAFIEK